MKHETEGDDICRSSVQPLHLLPAQRCTLVYRPGREAIGWASESDASKAAPSAVCCLSNKTHEDLPL